MAPFKAGKCPAQKRVINASGIQNVSFSTTWLVGVRGSHTKGLLSCVKCTFTSIWGWRLHCSPSEGWSIQRWRKTWQSLISQVGQQHSSFGAPILAKTWHITQLKSPFWRENMLSAAPGVTIPKGISLRAATTPRCFYTKKKWVLKCHRGRRPGQETKMQRARLRAGSSEEVLTSKACFRRRVLACQEQNQWQRVGN